MASPQYGYRFGERLIIKAQVDASTSAIEVGDLVVIDTAGYVAQAAAGDTPVGWALDACASPSADGDATIRVDVSTLSVYEIPPDAGSVTQALQFQTCDVGGPQSADIDASEDDVLLVRQVDVAANTLYVSLIPTHAGVA